MGTYVLHEHLFACQGTPFSGFGGLRPGERRRDIPAGQIDPRSPGFLSLDGLLAVKGSLEPWRKRSTHACQSAPCSAPDPCRRGHHPPRHGGRCGRCRPSGRPALAWALSRARSTASPARVPQRRSAACRSAPTSPSTASSGRRRDARSAASPSHRLGSRKLRAREQGLGRRVAAVPARRARLSLGRLRRDLRPAHRRGVAALPGLGRAEDGRRRRLGDARRAHRTAADDSAAARLAVDGAGARRPLRPSRRSAGTRASTCLPRSVRLSTPPGRVRSCGPAGGTAAGDSS